MDNLIELHVSAHVHQELIPQFPLEQLEILSMDGIWEELTILPRLKSIKELSVRTNPFIENVICTFPRAESFVGLRKLRLVGFSSVNLSGLTGLKHLTTIVNVPSTQIFGTLKIYPQLKSFFYHSNTDPGEEQECCYSLLKNVTDFALRVTNESQFILSNESKITSLELTHKDVSHMFCEENRFLERVHLTYCTLRTYSVFSNVEKLIIIDPFDGPTDITPLRNIAYLHLEGLSRVKSLSCLGHQRYLRIVRCDGLSNEAVNQHFRNVFHLFIDNCKNITEVVGLTNNSKIDIYGCQRLKRVVLHGKSYIYVSISDCDELTDFSGSGTIYSLRFVNNERCGKALCSLDYEYLNGEQRS
jgi:hypothetical protein